MNILDFGMKRTRGEGTVADIKYEIKEELGVISGGAKGWQKELNLISWNGELYNISYLGA